MLSARLSADVPTIIAGDFNEGDGGRAVRWLEGRGFVNALRRFDQRSHTWEWRTSVMTLRGRFDHLLHSAELACVDVQGLRRGASDHFPVVAVIAKADLEVSDLGVLKLNYSIERAAVGASTRD